MKEPSDLYTKKKVFAWLPVSRWTTEGKYVKESGFYWLRDVWVVRAGLLDEWTAYACYNE